VERTLDFVGSIIKTHTKQVVKQTIDQKANQDDSDDELATKPENQEFLKAIDLGETSSDEEE